MFLHVCRFCFRHGVMSLALISYLIDQSFKNSNTHQVVFKIMFYFILTAAEFPTVDKYKVHYGVFLIQQ